MKTTLLLTIGILTFATHASELTLGDWQCIGPFKDEEFGNLDRTLAYPFPPEVDYFDTLGVEPDDEGAGNLALLAKASSPDEMEIQGHAPHKANDGSIATYWDDQDGGDLYVLRLDWKKPVEFNTVTLVGWKQHDFSPRAFTLVADGKVVAEETDAVYRDNTYEIDFAAVHAKQLDLRVTGYYGGSPAVREITVSKRKQQKRTLPKSAINTDMVYQMQPFPGYLDLERKWQARTDWTDGYYNLLPRGPAPSRMEAVYLYRTIHAEAPQSTTVYLRVQDFYKAWLNGKEVGRHTDLTGRSRYQHPMPIKLDLQAGVNHLLIKNVSRWAEHGFSFAVDGIHDITDGFYYDIHAHSIDSPEKAENYLRRFKFSAQPIPMYCPATYDIEDTLASIKATPGAAAYDKQLKKLERETARVLKSDSDEKLVAHAKRLYTFLGDEVRKLPPIAFIRKPHHYQNAIAPYDNNGSLPAEICIFDPATPDTPPKTIYTDPTMRILDMSLSFDGKTIFFSAKNTTERYSWNIYEIRVDGKGLRQITHGAAADISPCELPNGRLAFVSTRKGTFVECQGRAAGLLYTMARDGSDVRLLSANIDSDHTPRVTKDGRVIFSRWDYGIEKNVFTRHAIWTVNPDGTNFQLVFGNTIEDPGGMWDSVAIPGRPELLVTFGPHHSHQAGMVGLVWNGKGTEAPRGTGYRWVTREHPVIGDRTYADGYQDPQPINEKQFIVSYGGEKHRLPAKKSEPKPKGRDYSRYAPLALLYLDAYGNERVIYKDEDGLSCFNPLLLQARQVPPVVADKVPPVAWKYEDPEEMNRSDAGVDLTATMLVQDVYKGISAYVKRGEAKYIAVMEQLQKSRVMAGGEAWGHTPLIGRGTVHARRLIGLVPIEEDGSAFFEVPALRSVSLNVLDADGKTLMRMGSDIHVMPEEKVSCIGCHEIREHGYGTAPPMMQKTPMALKKAPVVPRKQGWGTQGLIDYVTVVQPVWNKHCVRCHSGPNPKGGVNMTDDKTRFFNQSYDHLVDRDIVDHLSVFSLDHDEGTPNTVGAKVSTIDTYMDKEHCGSEVSWEERFRVYCWIDANVPYYPTYAYATLDNGQVRGLGARDSWESKNKKVTWASGDLQGMFDRRCADCHRREALNMSWLIPVRTQVYSDIWGDKALTSHGLGRKWSLVNKIGPEFRINLTNPSHSLLLQAPLAEDAGGAGLCQNADGSPVFADKSDADYLKGLEAIETGSARLKQYPRIDMMGREAFMDIGTCTNANIVTCPTGDCGE